jgi:hypothetical protein
MHFTSSRHARLHAPKSPTNNDASHCDIKPTFMATMSKDSWWTIDFSSSELVDLCWAGLDVVRI